MYIYICIHTFKHLQGRGEGRFEGHTSPHSIFIYIYISINLWIYIYVYIYSYIYVYVYVCICTYTYMCVNAYTHPNILYIYIYIYTHMYIHIFKHLQGRGGGRFERRTSPHSILWWCSHTCCIVRWLPLVVRDGRRQRPQVYKKNLKFQLAIRLATPYIYSANYMY